LPQHDNGGDNAEADGLGSMRKQKPAIADQHWWRHRQAHGCEAWQDADTDGVLRYRRCGNAGVLTYFEWRGEVAGWHHADGPRPVRRSSAQRSAARKPKRQTVAPKPDPYGGARGTASSASGPSGRAGSRWTGGVT